MIHLSFVCVESSLALDKEPEEVDGLCAREFTIRPQLSKTLQNAHLTRVLNQNGTILHHLPVTSPCFCKLHLNFLINKNVNYR